MRGFRAMNLRAAAAALLLASGAAAARRVIARNPRMGILLKNSCGEERRLAGCRTKFSGRTLGQLILQPMRAGSQVAIEGIQNTAASSSRLIAT